MQNHEPHVKGSEPEPFSELAHEFREAQALARGYVRAYKDQLTASLHTTLLRTAFFALLGVFGFAAAFAAGWLVIWGLADALSLALPVWAARLVTGGTIMVVSAGAAYFILRRHEHGRFEQKKAEYDRLLNNLH